MWHAPGARVVRGTLTAGVLALALAVQACGPASASTKATARYFGMHAPNLATDLPRAKVGAVNLTTNHVYWPDLQPTARRFDFTQLDTLVRQARARGAKPLLVLGQTPSFASPKPHAANVLATVPKMALWKRYVARVAGRYKSTIDYEIWPEPNIVQNWAGSPHQLAQLVVAASKIIHQKARHAVVVGPGMVLRMKYQRTFFDHFYAAKVGGVRVGHYVNAVGIDAYPLQNGTPEDSAALIRTAHKILASHHVKAPLWNVEMSYGVAGGHAAVHPLPAAKQASYVVRTFLLDAANGVKRVYWLGWARIAELGVQLVQPDGTTPTSAGKAYAIVRSWMLGQTVRSCSRNSKTHVWTCAMVKSGHASWVYWIPSGKAHVRARTGARTVETMTGATSPTRAGRTLTVTQAPIWVHH
jgi:hypothetical protein